MLTSCVKSNYRVTLNEKRDYDVTPSSFTSRQFASSPSRDKLAASARFKSGDLNSVHLDRAALSHVFHDAENEKKNHHHNGHKRNNGKHKHNPSQSAHSASEQQTSDDSNVLKLAGVDARTQDHTTSRDDSTSNARKDRKNKVREKFYTLLKWD